MNYEIHGGVTLKRVRLIRDAYFAGGQLKAQKGAVGLLASSYDGRGLVTFEYHSNPQLIALDGSGRQSQMIDLIDLEDN
jgi:hypothetical protein